MYWDQCHRMSYPLKTTRCEAVKKSGVNSTRPPTGPDHHPLFCHIEFENPVTGIADIILVSEAGITYPSPANAALAEFLNGKCSITEVTIVPPKTSRYFCWELPLFMERFNLLFQLEVEIGLHGLFGLIWFL